MSAQAPSGWTSGRIIALAAGPVLLLISLALIAGGAILIWADTGQMHSGYVTTTTATYSTRGYALTSDAITRHSRGLFVDEVRIRITSSGPSRPLFAGIAATGDVERHLSRVSYATVDGYDRRPSGHRDSGGPGRRGALGRAGPGDREPDPHLGGPGRRLDGGGDDERRRPPGPVRAGRSRYIGNGAAVAGQ